MSSWNYWNYWRDSLISRIGKIGDVHVVYYGPVCLETKWTCWKELLKFQPSKHIVVSIGRAFGYSSEDVQMVIENMASQGKEPTFCMGDDTPLAVLSHKPHMLFDYFKQRFAQVCSAFLSYTAAVFCSIHDLHDWFLILCRMKVFSGVLSRDTHILLLLSRSTFHLKAEVLQSSQCNLWWCSWRYPAAYCSAGTFEFNPICAGHESSHWSFKRRLGDVSGNHHWQTRKFAGRWSP